MRRPMLFTLIPWLAAAAAFAAGAGTEPATALWTTKVQPLLDVNCVKCHGPLQQKGGLELDTLAMLLKGGDDGAVVKPGQPQDSRLFKNLAPEADPHMPPKKQFSEGEREVIREWIAALPATQVPATNAAAPAQTARPFASPTLAIDTLVAEGWQQRGVTPAPPADDRTWVRRVYLDLAGRIPTPAELAEFLSAPADTRRGTLVERLLVSDDYAVRMRELWDVFLMGRPKRESSSEQRKEKGWWQFLEHAFHANRPWNEIVRDFLIARPEAKEDKGAAWFLYERRDNHQAIAEAVAPVVYGTRIDCAQCHDHPLAREIKQAHYWGLVAAFNRGKNVEGQTAVSESAVGGFINFTNLKKESQPAVVTLLSGGSVPEDRPAADQMEKDEDEKYVDPRGKLRVPKFSRRAAFAEAATHDNPLLARAFVNRMWAALLGRGMVQPPDQMNARNAPSHPELLNWLAQDFAAQHYDIQRLIRGIVLSRAYALTGAGSPPEAFASAAERPLSAEQLTRSWRIAAGLSPTDDALRRAAVTALPAMLPQDYNPTYQQAEFLANSPLLADLLKAEPGGTVARIVALKEPAERAREAFLAAYQRPPTPEEIPPALALLQANAAEPAAAVRDLLWALLTSAEFLTMP